MVEICQKKDLKKETCAGCTAFARCRRFIVQYGVPYDQAIAFAAKNECPDGYSPTGNEIIENGTVRGVILEGETIPKTF